MPLQKNLVSSLPRPVWECADTKKGGGYGRVLVDCPGLRRNA